MLLEKMDVPKFRRFAHDLASGMIIEQVPIGLKQHMLVADERYQTGHVATEIAGRMFVVKFIIEDMIGCTRVLSDGNFRFRFEPSVEVYLPDPPSLEISF